MSNFFYNLLLLQPVEWVTLVVLFTACAVQLFFYLHYYTAVIRYNRPFSKTNAADAPLSHQAQPPVSVIICARNEAENLVTFLPLVLEQAYPEFEVIVVNDGSSDNTEEVLASLKQRYPYLYITTIPNGARTLSPKKLAVTVGIKAAKHELLLFTDADCRPNTPNWIASMVEQFDDRTEFVLGYGGYFKEKTVINSLICFDTLFIAMQYFGFAFFGKPYMGVGRSMAYRKSVFFRARGFAGHLHIASGDDDLFVNATATGDNTRIACSAASKTLSVPKKTFKEWKTQKTRHLTTSHLYTQSSKNQLVIEPVTRGLFYLSFIVVCFSGQWLLAGSGIALFLLRYLTQVIVINVTAKHLQERKFYLSLPLWDILLPLLTVYMSFTGSSKKKNHAGNWHA
ncbi:MAG: glycosyltransferase [Prevotellaceae bacterium]|jgi:cellulose synthase/poly-beta-1,6-N-acetylglucosamine synthase-like glycosyltransferase|nr:glycosyltransferase [Prevotellaceae bacterium]